MENDKYYFPGYQGSVVLLMLCSLSLFVKLSFFHLVRDSDMKAWEEGNERSWCVRLNFFFQMVHSFSHGYSLNTGFYSPHMPHFLTVAAIASSDKLSHQLCSCAVAELMIQSCYSFSRSLFPSREKNQDNLKRGSK